MKKIYYYATYQIGSADEKDAASIIKANNMAQIKRASLHLFEDYKRYESYKEAYNFIMLNASSLGSEIDNRCISYLDATSY